MTSVNLTRTEAVERSRMIEVGHYDVTLDLKYSDTHFLSTTKVSFCLLYTSPSPRDKRQSRMPSSA